MMLIRTLTRAAGRLNFDVGEVIDLPDADAKDLIKAGCVQKAKPDDKPEEDEQQDGPE